MMTMKDVKLIADTLVTCGAKFSTARAFADMLEENRKAFDRRGFFRYIGAMIEAGPGGIVKLAAFLDSREARQTRDVFDACRVGEAALPAKPITIIRPRYGCDDRPARRPPGAR